MFWSLVLEPGRRYSSTIRESFHLSMATLDLKTVKNDKELYPVLLKFEGKEDAILCNVSKSNFPQAALDLNFMKGTKVTFFTSGSASIHLTGYILDDAYDTCDDSDLSVSDSSDACANSNNEASKAKGDGDAKSLWQQKKKRKSEEVLDVTSKKKSKSKSGEEDGSKNGLDMRMKTLNDNKVSDSDSDDDDEEDDDDDDDDDEDSMDDLDLGSDLGRVSGDYISRSSDDDDYEDNLFSDSNLGSDISDDDDDEDEDDDDDDEDDDSDDSDEVKPQKTPQQTPKKKFDEKKTPPTQTPKQGKTPQNQTPKSVKTPQNQTPASNKKQNKQQNVSLPNGATPRKDTPQPKQAGNKDTPQKQGGSPKKQTLVGGVQVEELKPGRGPVAKPGKMVTVYYTGRLKSNNRVFDQSDGAGFKFRLGKGEVIKGWDIGVAGMPVGSKRRITCPANMAYGSKGSGSKIPPNSALVFDIEVKSVN